MKLAYSNDNKPHIRQNLIQAITLGTYGGTDSITYGDITHYKYEDCPQSKLVYCCGKQVHILLANAFEKMKADAAQDDIELEIVSGFRSVEYQKTIFPCKFADKTNPSEEEFIARLRFSAPPGFSEHHTGLAVDINSLEEDFADTKEYNWLLTNADRFGFEMSFPRNNFQGLGFEPWHWRYIGTDETRKVFKYKY